MVNKACINVGGGEYVSFLWQQYSTNCISIYIISSITAFWTCTDNVKIQPNIII